MTVKATGASATSVKRIVGEKDGTKSPGKSKPKRKKAFDRLDEFDLGVIRRMMHSFYAKGESPTLAKMHKKLKEGINFPHQISRLRLVLKILGFQFKRKARESVIHERPDLIMWRERYLRRIKEIRENEPRTEIEYTDETWLNSGHKIKKEWVDLEALENPRRSLLEYGTVGTTKCSTGKGKRLIIVDCITENGPVPGALWTFSAESKPKQEKEVENQFVETAVAQEKANEMSKSEDHRGVVNTHQMQTTSKSGKRKSLGANESLSKPKRFKEGVKSVDEEESTDEESAVMSKFDYHDTINSENYEKYFEKVCQLLKPNSVIVTDNASYHSRNDVNYPFSKWKKAQFQDWLTQHNIPFNSDDLRAELWLLCKRHRVDKTSKVIDNIAKKYGHEILRLPPYHCELNAI